MTNPSVLRLLWHGRRSIREVLDRLAESGRAEIQLAPDYHHALYRTITERPARVEQLDMEGSPELLDRIAQVRGLEPLSELVAPLTAQGARVHVMSPGPIITIVLPPKVSGKHRDTQEHTIHP